MDEWILRGKIQKICLSFRVLKFESFVSYIGRKIKQEFLYIVVEIRREVQVRDIYWEFINVNI